MGKWVSKYIREGEVKYIENRKQTLNYKNEEAADKLPGRG